MVTPDARRKAVAHACVSHGVSQRRACQALGVDRTSVRYRSVRTDDAPLKEVMRAVAGERRRFDLPPKKWTGLSRSAFHLGRADVAEG